MTSQQILHADVLDILFEHRNKAYGAYYLRKTYNHRLLLSLLLTFSFIFLLLLALPSKGKENILPAPAPDGEVYVRLIDETPPPVEQPTPPPQQAAAAPVAQAQYNQVAITPDADAEAEVPPQDVLAGSIISDVTVAGTPDIGLVPQVDGSNSAGNGTAVPEVKEEKAFVPSYAAPQFPGGTEAWLRFLNRHLQAPDGLEKDERKTVHIRFLVSADGRITRFEVVQSGGPAFDNEVIRVLKKMPKWKPAQQNGKPVAVMFTQPVTFVQVEE